MPFLEPRSCFLAIDLGTTDLKVGVVAADDGRLLALERAPAPVAEPERWWAAVRSLVPIALGRAGVGATDVRAVCADGHGPTCVPCDADGQVVAEVVPWSDGRAATEASELAAATGLGTWALSILPAAAWLERNRSTDAGRVQWYLNSWEWLALRLSGIAGRTRSAGQLLADPTEPSLAAVVDPSKTPEGVDAGTVIGGLRADVAAELGLEAGTPVVAGLNDAFASCLGIGLLEPGDGYDAGGSAGGFAVYTDRPVEVPGAFSAAAPVPGRWYVGAVMNATGRALEWLASSTATSAATLLDEAAAVPAGARGLVFLPYLAGERSPLWDPAARGAFVGLTLGHRRPELARAVLESAALALRHVAEPILAAGVPIRELRVSGRPAESPTWNRIKADVTGFPVGVPAVPEAALVGCAVLSAVAIGFDASIPSAIGRMVRVVDRLEPDMALRPTYDQLFDVYCRLSRDLLPASHALASVP
ncbi:MAG TPA: FGGY-family carbohydrate kinase [Candidatus Limnocylindrales bacterium]|nr:FGGY-family carbohydrate kinase [Candidatus Limnocylindrales bacterium]